MPRRKRPKLGRRSPARSEGILELPLCKPESAKWTLIRFKGIEPTNNDIDWMLSVVATARQQNRNVLELLTACCSAVARWLRCSFFVARTGHRLISEFWPGPGCSVAQVQSPASDFWTDFQRVSDLSGGGENQCNACDSCYAHDRAV